MLHGRYSDLFRLCRAFSHYPDPELCNGLLATAFLWNLQQRVLFRTRTGFPFSRPAGYAIALQGNHDTAKLRIILYICRMVTENLTPRGRFAPSPSGRMHLGNIFTALMSWLSVKSRGGKWVLRIEDLDPQRSKLEHARMIEDDLLWLGLEWDEGGLDDIGTAAPYSQSLRGDIYEEYLKRLETTGFLYPCRCRRADILATQAPHRSDGRVVYAGTCRPVRLGGCTADSAVADGAALRLFVPDMDILFTDRLYGSQRANLAEECGDFIVRRADGAWAYQFAVVVDDALMGITEVVRGNDLLLSTAQQIYLCGLLGFPVPDYAHLPLVCNAQGQRLSKRDSAMGMGELRQRYTPSELLGKLAFMAGLSADGSSVSLPQLLRLFRWPEAKDTLEIC